MGRGRSGTGGLDGGCPPRRRGSAPASAPFSPAEEGIAVVRGVLLVVGHDGLPGGRRRAGRAGWAWILEETRKNVFRGERGPLPPHFDTIIFNRPEKGAGLEHPQILSKTE